MTGGGSIMKKNMWKCFAAFTPLSYKVVTVLAMIVAFVLGKVLFEFISIYSVMIVSSIDAIAILFVDYIAFCGISARHGKCMEIFKSFSKGYLESAESFLTPVEKENLPYAACLFPYMQCVRFFADYINGDTYYKIKYPRHNWDRTRNQWALFESAMACVPEMKKALGL